MTQDRAYRFSSFRLDPQTWRLRKNNEFRPLRPKTFSILRYLLDNAGQLVSKEDLFREVWPGVNVENSALRVCMNELRQVLDDDPHRPRFVETVHRRGYRFIAPVELVTDEEEEPAQLLHSTAVVVGREQETARLLQLWERALAGTRQVAFVAGEPGIGKSTLVDKLLSAPLVSRFALAGRGHCADQYGKGDTYLPVFEALGQICDGRRGKNARDIILRDAPSWADNLPEVRGAETPGTSRATPTQMLTELNRALNTIATKRPLMIVLEDLHLSDRATVELIAYLAKRRDPARLMIVGTYRSTLPRRDVAQLAATVRDLESHKQCTRLLLQGLSETEVANYLDHRISRSMPPKLVKQLYRRTGGNPLFLTAIVDHFEALELAARSWPEDLRELGLPDNVHAMIEQQIEELSSEDQKLLKLASVAGATGLDFSSAALAPVLPDEGNTIDQDYLEEKCEQLVRRVNFFRAAGVARWPDGTVAASYGFGHALYQEVLYGLMSAGQRARAHLRIGERLAQAYGAQAPRIALELAMHFERGGDSRRAALHLNDAADTAISRASSRQALVHIDKALKLLRAVPADANRTIAELRLEATRLIGLSASEASTEKVDASLQRMGDLTREAGHPDVPVLLFQGVAKLLIAPADEAGELLVRTALQRAETEKELAGIRTHAHVALSITYNVQGKFREAAEHAEKAIETYDPGYQAPVADSKAFGMTEYAAAQWFLGFQDKACKGAHDAIAFAEKISHVPATAFATARAATIYAMALEPKPSLVLAEKLFSLSSDKDLRMWRSWALFLRGGARVQLGEAEEGCRMMRSALTELDTHEMPRTPATTVHPRAALRFSEVPAGLLRPREAAEHIRGLIDECIRHGADAFLSDMYRMLALLKAADETYRSGASEAEALLRKAMQIAQKQGALSFELRVAIDLARLLHQRNRSAEAGNLLSSTYSKFTEGFGTPDLKSAKALLAELGVSPSAASHRSAGKKTLT